MSFITKKRVDPIGRGQQLVGRSLLDVVDPPSLLFADNRFVIALGVGVGFGKHQVDTQQQSDTSSQNTALERWVCFYRRHHTLITLLAGDCSYRLFGIQGVGEKDGPVPRFPFQKKVI